ncbi:serine carboxypeptidase [Panus rudis PR-1116 ss-1]|nr:serine carboxypeptidase [Panus rudis PR-1116 ss-1]
MMFTSPLSLLGLAATVGHCSAQHVFGVASPPGSLNVNPNVAFEGYDEGLFSPMEDLSLLSSDSFTTLTHPVFPKYSVRVKKSTDFCDGTVNAYTGYIDIQVRHLFFYFFESRSNPDEDDVIFWTNGGPGCSSALGLFMELGPCRVKQENATTFNPHSWNEHANIFFIDQPIGVGYSYAEYGETVSTTEEAAKDIAAFVTIFFEHFTKFKGRSFHMAGESYGGRYIPVFASEIYDQNAKLKDSGVTPINLTSIMIGNGCTDWSTMVPSYYDMQCTPKSVAPINSVSECVGMRQLLPRCEQRIKASCRDTMDAIDCNAAATFCSDAFRGPFSASGYNPYDLTKLCEGELRDTLCYPITKTISAYLDSPKVRKSIGVDPSVGNFSSCNREILTNFANALDSWFPTHYYISALLDRGIRTLIYVGANDWICNWVGNERMTLSLEWNDQEAFVSQPLAEWKVNGTAAGLTRSAGPLTFATIYGAGHMVPYDQPEASLELVKRWLEGENI